MYLKIHVKNHINGQFKCDNCDKIFRRKELLNAHLDQVHNNTSKVKCDFCEKKMLITSLKIHMKYAHSKQAEIKCDKCDKSFKNE